MTTDYNADEIDRLVREGREDDERTTPGPWVAVRDGSNHRGKVYETGRAYEHVATTYCGAFDGHGYPTAEAIARTRNNLPAMVAALSAAKAEVERLTAGCTACRLENEANAEENDRLAAEVERLTNERDEACNRVLRPLTEGEVVAALNAWTSLVKERDRLAANLGTLIERATKAEDEVTRLSARVRELELTEEAKDALRWLRSLVEEGDCGLAGKLAVAVATLDCLTMPGAK